MLKIDCPYCGKQLQVSAKHVGTKGRCKRCGKIFTALTTESMTSKIDSPAVSDTVSVNNERKKDLSGEDSHGYKYKRYNWYVDLERCFFRIFDKVALSPPHEKFGVRQITGIVGTVIFFLGLFLPIVDMPFMGSMNYFQSGTGSGVTLIFIVFSFIAILLRKDTLLFFTSLSCIGMLTLTFMRHIIILKQFVFGGGWVVLIIGVGLMITPIFIKSTPEYAYNCKFFKLTLVWRITAATICGLCFIFAVILEGITLSYPRGEMISSEVLLDSTHHSQQSSEEQSVEQVSSEPFLDFTFGCSIEEAIRTIEHGEQHTQFKERIGNQAEECNIIYFGNNKLLGADYTSLQFWQGRLYLVVVYFGSDEDKCKRLFTVLKQKITQKYGEGKENIVFNSDEVEWNVQGMQIILKREGKFWEDDTVLLAGGHLGILSQLENHKLQVESKSLGEL
ncbi:MAG: hypothetical protein KAH38_08480 [Candidatus Hydrogenedentes bacterium]|nr:hypothetical protein [Candidatus Hydrogenedentota bacterium]